jgi:hypothetical protein
MGGIGVRGGKETWGLGDWRRRGDTGIGERLETARVSLGLFSSFYMSAAKYQKYPAG